MESESSAASSYPIRFEVAYPEEPGGWRILVRWLLAIPQIIVADLLQSVAEMLAFFALFTILFTRRYPEPMFRIVVGAVRWQLNVFAYALMQDSPYPPFSLDEGEYPHVSYDVTRQEEYSRWLPLVKWLLAIPHYIVLALLFFVAIFVWLYCAVVVVATGRFPRGGFDFLVGVGRWGIRVNVYLLLQVDDYPPFSLS